jgi:hypothetical protein
MVLVLIAIAVADYAIKYNLIRNKHHYTYYSIQSSRRIAEIQQIISHARHLNFIRVGLIDPMFDGESNDE